MATYKKDEQGNLVLSRHSKVTAFNNRYKVAMMCKYGRQILISDEFTNEAYHHFIIQRSGRCIFFVWDTRQVEYECHKDQLPESFMRANAFDNYDDLVGYVAASAEPQLYSASDILNK